MIYEVIEWVYYVCCMVCMICVGEWTFHWTVKDKKRFVIAGIIYAISFVFLYIPIENVIPYFLLFYVGEITAWTLICEGELKSRLVKILAIFYGVGVVEMVYTLPLEMLIRDRVAEEVLQLVAILLSTISLVIVTKQKWYKSSIECMQTVSRKWAVLILCTVIVGLLMVGYGRMVHDIVQSNAALWLYQILFLAELLLVVGIAVGFGMERSQKKYYLEQNALKEEVLHTQQEYYKTIYEKDREMRSFRHDVANQLGILHMLLRSGDMEGARTQLERINAEFEGASFQKLHVGDELLDAVFSMMNQKAEEKHIQLEVKGRLEKKKQYNSYELCTIFSNAISNAIEACEKLESDGPIYVNIMEEGTLCCAVENPGTEEMYRQIQQGETTKEDAVNHGYGIGNIQRAVKRLNGESEYRYKNGKIKLGIYI